MVFTVARAYGQPPHLVACWPFAWVALAMLHELKRRRAARLEHEADAIRMGVLVNYAVNDPAKLSDAHRALMERAGAMPSAAETMAAGERLLASALRTFTDLTPADDAAN